MERNSRSAVVVVSCSEEGDTPAETDTVFDIISIRSTIGYTEPIAIDNLLFVLKGCSFITAQELLQTIQTLKFAINSFLVFALPSGVPGVFVVEVVTVARSSCTYKSIKTGTW